MLDAFRKLFAEPDPEPEAPDDGRLALAALLVDAARRDGDYAEAERAAIDRILMAEHELDAGAARALRVEAEDAQRDAAGIFRFTHALKQSTPFDERVRIVEHLWEVALADGDRDAAEDNLVRRVCGLIGVPDRESGLARRRVEARMDG